MASPWYGNTQAAAAIPPAVAERALQWLVELQDEPVAPETLQAWRRWRAAHPHHEQAWQRVESVTGRLRTLAGRPGAPAARAALAASGAAPRRRAMKVLAAAAVTGTLAWSAERHTPWRQWAADHRTDVGERRRVVLADGTQLTLNTGSAVDIRYDDAERRVRLIAGEILVRTAPDDRALSRPFLVETAEGTAQALGTEYAVRRRQAGTEVSVFEGSVRIRLRRQAGRALVLHAGHRAAYTERAVTLAEAADETSVAWQDGFIVARAMRLDAFLAELGRYTEDNLSCEPAVAAVRVSGSFPVDDVAKVLAVLGATLGLRIRTDTHAWRGTSRRLLPARA